MSFADKKNIKLRLRSLNEQRAARIRKLIDRGLIESAKDIPGHAIPIDLDSSTKAELCMVPTYYEDIEYECMDCGKRETWRAETQQYYFETLKSPRLIAAQFVVGIARGKKSGRFRGMWIEWSGMIRACGPELSCWMNPRTILFVLLVQSILSIMINKRRPQFYPQMLSGGHRTILRFGRGGFLIGMRRGRSVSIHEKSKVLISVVGTAADLWDFLDGVQLDLCGRGIVVDHQ